MDTAQREKDPVLSKVRFLKESDLARVLNGAYIAERFFGKSGSWFSQKLNNNVKNGKPTSFTPEELTTLCDGIEALSYELLQLADDLREQ